MDTDNSGTISEEEWLNFWTSVLRSGHSEEEISDEVQIPPHCSLNPLSRGPRGLSLKI